MAGVLTHVCYPIVCFPLQGTVSIVILKFSGRGRHAVARKCFYSFYYNEDSWRASKIRNIGVIEGSQSVSDNDWETIKKGRDPAIEKWIKGQLVGKSCTILLIGTNTADRKWIDYEIKESWGSKKGLLGIYIHNITDRIGNQSSMGTSPFASFNLNGTPLTSIVKSYNPPYGTSSDAYNYIAKNIEGWVDEAVAIRENY
jgi:hypothetical protein